MKFSHPLSVVALAEKMCPKMCNRLSDVLRSRCVSANVLSRGTRLLWLIRYQRCRTDWLVEVSM